MRDAHHLRTDVLACPLCRGSLVVGTRAVEDAQDTLRPGSPFFTAASDVRMRCAGCGAGYPVVDGVPVLMAPEVLSTSLNPRSPDHPFYAEAYAEMPFYSGGAGADALHVTSSRPFAIIDAARKARDNGTLGFPTPDAAWLDQPSDVEAHREAYEYLSPIVNQRVLQVGGKGTNVIRMLLAGATEGWLLTPMLGEIQFALAAARETGVADRLFCALGVAEEAPFLNSTFNKIFAGGCVHHMQTDVAFPQFSRILLPGGRFAAVEPWRAPLYTLGTAVFGKREPNPYCRPLTRSRTAPLAQAFRESTVAHHGTFLRYPMLAAMKTGWRPGVRLARQIMRLDDGLASLLGLRRFGSCVALLGER